MATLSWVPELRSFNVPNRILAVELNPTVDDPAI